MNNQEAATEIAPDKLAKPPKRSWLKWIFRWRTLGILLFLGAGLVTLALLINTEENWRAARAWNECRRKLEAKGERLELAAHLPAPVAPEQNFAMIAPLAAAGPGAQPVNLYLNGQEKVPGLGDWRTAAFIDFEAWRDYFSRGTNYPRPVPTDSAARDVLTALGRFDGVFAELRSGAQRPRAQFPVSWTNDPMALSMPHLATVKATAQAVKLRAAAELAAGRADEALADLRVSFKFISALESDPVMISFLVRVALVDIVVQPIWEGLARQRWNEAQLAVVETELARLNFVADGVRVLRGERAFGNAVAESLILNTGQAARPAGEAMAGTERRRPFLVSLVFPCWIVRRSQVLNSECQQDIIESLQQAVADPARSPLLDPALTNAWKARWARTTPYNALSKTLAPVMFRLPPAACRAQAVVALVRTGCAVERYRLAHGSYPEKLSLLAPRFLERLPLDPYVGQPLHYRVEEDGSFLLYSVGANLLDEGGKIQRTKTGGLDVNQGDLVWACASRR